MKEQDNEQDNEQNNLYDPLHSIKEEAREEGYQEGYLAALNDIELHLELRELLYQTTGRLRKMVTMR